MELIYLRKSQADNPNESVEEVLEKHEYPASGICNAGVGLYHPRRKYLS